MIAIKADLICVKYGKKTNYHELGKITDWDHIKRLTRIERVSRASPSLDGTNGIVMSFALG